MGNILEKIREAREGSRKRKFAQTWDFFINLKNIDLKKPESRLNLSFALPYGIGKDIKVAVFSDTITEEAKKFADHVITKQEIEGLASDKRRLKKLVDAYDWFFGEASVMPMIGKTLGTVMGPKGKVPKPIPPKMKLEPVIKSAKESVRIILKDNPVIHVRIGRDNMKDEDVAANAEAVLNFVKEKLPKGQDSIKSAHIKLTMGKPIKISMR